MQSLNCHLLEEINPNGAVVVDCFELFGVVVAQQDRLAHLVIALEQHGQFGLVQHFEHCDAALGCRGRHQNVAQRIVGVVLKLGHRAHEDRYALVALLFGLQHHVT